MSYEQNNFGYGFSIWGFGSDFGGIWGTWFKKSDWSGRNQYV
ncbi:Hypothetical protein I595_1228 [Croceitalea dokdonensis DOKDO 023]|uniref:Uncharacterized protein n=1 Tax=Croceitalea dokdonensis DOKDO 023 TaxID=1300341 RepID=A0A0P7ALL3_9FLAO|nr:Hypothetical protein I595_1228 [Croceitalea dokdonensis DOKDO 023]